MNLHPSIFGATIKVQYCGDTPSVASCLSCMSDVQYLLQQEGCTLEEEQTFCHSKPPMLQVHLHHTGSQANATARATSTSIALSWTVDAGADTCGAVASYALGNAESHAKLTAVNG